MQSITRIFIQQIDQFLADTGMSPTAFGLATVKDKNFVSDLRNGRAATSKTMDKVIRWMDAERRQRATAEAAAE